MAIVLRGTVHAGVQGVGSSVAVTVDAARQDGDLMLAMINGYGNAGVPPSNPITPAGWTLIGVEKSIGVAQGTTALGLYRRIASSEPASYTFSNDNAGVSNYIAASIMVLGGQDPTTPFNLTSLATHGNGTPIATADLGSTTRDGCWHILFASSYDGISGLPSGYVTDIGYDSTSDYVMHRVVTTAGATGAKSFTIAGTDGTATWAVAVQPPPAAVLGTRRLWRRMARLT